VGTLAFELGRRGSIVCSQSVITWFSKLVGADLHFRDPAADVWTGGVADVWFGQFVGVWAEALALPLRQT